MFFFSKFEKGVYPWGEMLLHPAPFTAAILKSVMCVCQRHLISDGLLLQRLPLSCLLLPRFGSISLRSYRGRVLFFTLIFIPLPFKEKRLLCIIERGQDHLRIFTSSSPKLLDLGLARFQILGMIGILSRSR